MKVQANWTSLFPGLENPQGEALHALRINTTIVELPAGSRIFGPGHAPESFLLLIEGTVRVQQVSEGGREIVLYRIHAGESCALTTACLMGFENYQAEGLAETNVRAAAIPRRVFDYLIASSPDFRRFVFSAFSARVTDLFRIIDDIAFSRIDIRLAHKLIELSHGSKQLSLTQQQLASELGTAREVVSRMLAEFQRRGWIILTRGHIELIEIEKLSNLAREH
jgi:CRP/FNR family transcriptional regulator, anaerobic regulatory protein